MKCIIVISLPKLRVASLSPVFRSFENQIVIARFLSDFFAIMKDSLLYYSRGERKTKNTPDSKIK